MEITWRFVSEEGSGENGRKVQGIKSINGRYKTDRRRLRIVWEMEKPKNLYAPPMDVPPLLQVEGGTGGKIGTTTIA